MNKHMAMRIVQKCWVALLLVGLVDSGANAGLYRWFKLDDGAGDVATDSGPNKEHGTIFEATWVTDPTRGVVLEFDGEANWVDAGYLPLMDLDNDFTWSFWENQSELQASPANDIILGSRYGDGGTVDTAPREFIKFTPNRFEYHMNGGFANDMTYGADDLEHIPSDGEWRHHVVVKAADQLAYYRNGEFFNEHSLVDPQFSEDPLPFALGGQHGVEGWAGLLSDVRLFDEALTESQVQTLFAGGDPLGPTDPLAPLDDGTLTDPTERANYVHNVMHTWVGDSNLDGEFNSADFVTVFSAGQYEDQTAANSSWVTGDWDGNKEFDSSDFVAAFVDGGYENGVRAATAAVPEPSGMLLSLCAFLAMATRCRR